MEINFTENSYMYQSAKRLLQKELDKCVQKMKDTEDKWNEYMDLKLHYASIADVDIEGEGYTVKFDDEKCSEMFYRFCEQNYDMFIEDLKYNFDIDFYDLRDRIGSTSSFYLGKMHNNYDNKYIVALAEACTCFNVSPLDFYQDKEGRIIIDEVISKDWTEDLEDMTNSMLELVEDMYDELCNYLKPIETVYDIIHDFKENQTEYFKEWVKDEFENGCI
jgi:hypothetical protein